MMILLKVSSSSGSSTNGERGEIPPSSSSGVSTSSIIIGPPEEGRKGSPPNSDSIDSEGESIIVSGSPETLGLGVWVGDEGDSCLTLEVDGLVKMELLAPARNLHLESLALCMSFLFLQVKLIVLFLIFQVTLGARREHTQETTRSITFSFLILQITLKCKRRAYFNRLSTSLLEILCFIFFFLRNWLLNFHFPSNGAKMFGQFSVPKLMSLIVNSGLVS